MMLNVANVCRGQRTVRTAATVIVYCNYYYYYGCRTRISCPHFMKSVTTSMQQQCKYVMTANFRVYCYCRAVWEGGGGGGDGDGNMQSKSQRRRRSYREEEEEDNVSPVFYASRSVSIVTITDGCRWWWIKRSKRWPRGHPFSFLSPSVAAHPWLPLRHWCGCRAKQMQMPPVLLLIRPMPTTLEETWFILQSLLRVVSCRAVPCQPLCSFWFILDITLIDC